MSKLSLTDKFIRNLTKVTKTAHLENLTRQQRRNVRKKNIDDFFERAIGWENELEGDSNEN
tara:strand:+ start:18734 stop:18916 length:183 start_codon:yes stop_codon:yes gene_type:complete